MTTMHLNKEDGAVSALELIKAIRKCLQLTGRDDLPVVGGQASDDMPPDRLTILTADNLEWHPGSDKRPAFLYLG